VEFTRRLVPHLKAALQSQSSSDTIAAATPNSPIKANSAP
jgi:hypothetical protein